MPDAALDATVRQFRALLGAAADEDMAVRLTLYTLPEVPRTDLGREHLRGYSGIGDLWDSHLDGLIVTGAEPRAADLEDEPYWESLTRVLEWAEGHTRSTILSCLAAHAGILHIDGIARRPLGEKRFGVAFDWFEHPRVCDRAAPRGAIEHKTARMAQQQQSPASALLAELQLSIQQGRHLAVG